MRHLLLALLVVAALPAQASWTRRFRQSDQMYRVHVNHRDDRLLSAGFYLTSFPCYSMNSSEYFQTVNGKNMITLFCLAPPEEIMLSYVTKTRGTFISRNEPMVGYMKCPVAIRNLMRTSVVPRLEVYLEDCEKRELNRGANEELINRFNNTAKGTTVSEFFREDEAKQQEEVPPPEKPAQFIGGTIPYVEAYEQ